MENSWQPIETAPKDGTNILLYENGIICVCSYVKPHLLSDDAKYWTPMAGGLQLYDFNGDIVEEFESPTHWMPLPEPPRP